MASEIWLVRKAAVGSDPENGTPALAKAPAGGDLYNVSLRNSSKMIDGLVPRNSSGDATNDITFGVGRCVDSTGIYGRAVTVERTKRADATWAAGDAAGMHPGGSATAWGAGSFQLFALFKSTDPEAFDFGMDSSATAANLMANAAVAAAGFDLYRRVGSPPKTTGAAWVTFAAKEKEGGALWIAVAPQIDTGITKDWSGADNAAQTGASAIIPNGVQMEGRWMFQFADNAASAPSCILFSSFDVANVAPVDDSSNPFTGVLASLTCNNVSGAATRAMGQFDIMTRASDAAIRYRGADTGAAHSLGNTFQGYTDFRVN